VTAPSWAGAETNRSEFRGGIIVDPHETAALPHAA
jgi:hypothetical protein